MIKTLKITGILAVVFALALVVVLARLALRGDQKTKEFLDSAGIIQNYQRNDRDKGADGEQKSPLVQEAEAFALRLNPPKPKKTARKKAPARASGSKGSVATKPSLPKPKLAVRANFKLMATCVYQLDPMRSLALLDLTAKGTKWVRQGETVGHLTIHEIKDGSVVLYQNGKQNSEIFTPPPKSGRSLLKSDASSNQRSAQMPRQPAGAAVQRSALPQTGVSDAKSARRRAQPAKPSAAQQEEVLLENIAGIQQVMDTEKTKKKKGKTDKEKEDELRMLDELFKMLVQEHDELKETPPTADKKKTGGKGK